MFRVIQISDTHISPTKAHFAGNWPPLAEWIASQRPDLVIHTGDVTVDGLTAIRISNIACGCSARWACRLRRARQSRCRRFSNHRHQPVNPERIARWNRYFGAGPVVSRHRRVAADRPRRDADRRLPGGRGGAARLARRRHGAGGDRRSAWFLHRPLFIEHPEEGDTGYWSIKPEPRRALLEMVRRHNVALVASGHLHKAHDFVRDGTRYIGGRPRGFWAARRSFRCGPARRGSAPSATSSTAAAARRHRRGAGARRILDRRRGRRGVSGACRHAAGQHPVID